MATKLGTHKQEASLMMVSKERYEQREIERLWEVLEVVMRKNGG